MNMASHRRNPILADIISRLKYMERRGSGFRKIVLAYKGHDAYKEGMDPTFTTPWDSFVLTLPKFNVVGVEGIDFNDEDDTETINNQGGQKGEEKTINTILQLIKDNPTITRNAIAEVIGISPSAIQKHINRLKTDNIIVRHGGDRGGHWEVQKD